MTLSYTEGRFARWILDEQRLFGSEMDEGDSAHGSLIIFSNGCNESSCNVTRIVTESHSIIVSTTGFSFPASISAQRPDNTTDVFIRYL
jgi:hypothetical protein